MTPEKTSREKLLIMVDTDTAIKPVFENTEPNCSSQFWTRLINATLKLIVLKAHQITTSQWQK